MSSPNKNLKPKSKKKRLLKSLISDDDEDLITNSCDKTDFEDELNANKSNYSEHNIKNKINYTSHNSNHNFQKRNKKDQCGVLRTLLDSIVEKEVIKDNHNLKNKKNFKKNKNNLNIDNLENMNNNLELIDINNLLNNIDNMGLNMKLKENSENIENTTNSSIINSQTDFDKLENDELILNSFNEFEITNLTEIEKGLLNYVKNDFNYELKLNEWLPSQYLEIKSEIINNLDKDLLEINNLERYDFFYKQWMEQYQFLSILTDNFTRNVNNCFLNEGKTLSRYDIKEKNNLFLDPEDKILISVQNIDGYVLLNKLIQIANSQQKLIIEMNNELNGLDEDLKFSDIRIKFGVVSKKARRKLWWLCRVAEHCGLITHKGKQIKKYVLIEKSERQSNYFISSNARINSSIDPTMCLFEFDSEKDQNQKDGSKECKHENEDQNKDQNFKQEIDLKWENLLSMKISNRTRPWEKKKDDIENHEKISKKDLGFNSKLQLFKFMLKNIGPRPFWTEKNNQEKNDNFIFIEIEPPNTSLREQSQLKIKWMQMYKQAEKLAIHHFKIIDADTKELDKTMLKYWCEQLKVNLFIPELNINKINNESNSKKLEIKNTDFVNVGTEVVEKNIKEIEITNNQYFESNNYCSLPLEIEYVDENDCDLNESNDHNQIENNVILDNQNQDDKIKFKEFLNEENNSDIEEKVEILNNDIIEDQRLDEVNYSENSADIEDNELLLKKKKVYDKIKRIRMNKRKLKKKIMRKYSYLLEDEAEESDEDGVKILKRGIEEENEEDDEDLDWDELSEFSDFIDDNNHEAEELNSDAIQAHLKHIEYLEEKQYRQLFTLEGLKERKNKKYLSSLYDDDISGETRLEKKKNELLFNSKFFDDDVISEFWTDEESYNDLDEEIDERNLTEMLGIDYDEWQENLSSKIKSSDETLNEKRRKKYKQLKDGLLKEASSQINILKQRFNNIKSKLDNINLENEEKDFLEKKYFENAEKLKKLLYSIHLACNKCIYENHQYFDLIDIDEYIKRRQKNRESQQVSIKGSKQIHKNSNGSFRKKALNSKIISSINLNLNNTSDSEEDLVKQNHKKEKDIFNIKGGRFVISKKN